MKLLHIDSSILGENSVSRRLSAGIVNRLKAGNPGIDVTYRDLAASPLPHLSGAHLAVAQNPQGDHAPAAREAAAAGDAALDEFLAADTVVIGVAFYNFTISTQLKAWIDRIVVARRTFRYGDRGQPEGLAGGKRVILAIARGGFYGDGTPAQAAEHAESYLRAVLGFIGIPDPEVVAAEGVLAGPEGRAAAIASGEAQIAALAV